jgi:hypothetical protein
VGDAGSLAHVPKEPHGVRAGLTSMRQKSRVLQLAPDCGRGGIYTGPWVSAGVANHS